MCYNYMHANVQRTSFIINTKAIGILFAVAQIATMFTQLLSIHKIIGYGSYVRFIYSLCCTSQTSQPPTIWVSTVSRAVYADMVMMAHWLQLTEIQLMKTLIY